MTEPASSRDTEPVLIMRATRALIIAVSITLYAAPASRADDLEVLRRVAAEAQQRTQDELLACPEFRPGQIVKLHEIVRIAVDHGLIMAQAALPVPPGQSVQKVRLEGLEGWARLTIRAPRQLPGVEPPPAPASEWYIGLLHSKRINSRDRQDLSIDAQASGVTVSRNQDSPQRTLSVMFKQVKGSLERGVPPQVALSVYDRDDQRGNPVSITISEPDFEILRRHHAAEVNQYLRPLLREFKVGGLFTVDSVAANQVFPRQWKRDEAMAQKVTALVQKLDADDYAERQAAMLTLREMGPEAALYVFHQDQSSLSTEQLARIDVLMITHRLLGREQAARMADDPDFLLDCMEGDDPALRHAAVERLERLMGKRVEVDESDSAEARSLKVEKMRTEVQRVRQERPATR